MSHVLHRRVEGRYPVAVRGDGPYLIDRDGKRYLDASGGPGVSCLGHDHPRVRDAIKRQVDSVAYVHTSFFTSEPMEELADLLIADAPGTLDKVVFVSGGSEANEAAMKIVRQYFLETGQPQRRRFISRRQSFLGNTLGTLSVGGNAARRASYEPLLFPVELIAPCYAYRDRRAAESEEAYGRRVADELDATIQRLGPETVAAFIAEPVVGATLGTCPSVPGYFPRIREICDRYGVLLILDEVMCGMGRTGTLHASAQDGVVPELMTVAKGLGAGYQPIGAVLVDRKISEAIRAGSGDLMHGHTYMGHPIACAAGLAVQHVIRDENLIEKVQRQGRILRDALDERFGNHHHVGDIRGRGLFLSLELVQDRANKAPFDPSKKLYARVKAEGMARGLMCYPMGGTIDGKRGDHVTLAPPFNIGPEHITEIIDKLGAAIDAAIAGAR